MRFLIEEKPSLEELLHFGIPGMKWGRRKSKVRTEKSIKRRERLKTAGEIASVALLLLGPAAFRLSIGSMAAKHMAAQGAKHTANVLATKGLTNYKTLNMVFNSTTGIWE